MHFFVDIVARSVSSADGGAILSYNVPIVELLGVLYKTSVKRVGHLRFIRFVKLLDVLYKSSIKHIRDLRFVYFSSTSLLVQSSAISRMTERQFRLTCHSLSYWTFCISPLVNKFKIPDSFILLSYWTFYINPL